MIPKSKRTQYSRPAAFVCALLLFGAASTATAQDSHADHSGYIDFDSMGDVFGITPSLEVNVHGILMEMAANAARESEPEVSNLLDHLIAVQVRGFDVEFDRMDDFMQHSQRLLERLEGEGWQTVVHVRKDDEQVDVMLNEREGAIAGLLVMVKGEDGERVFVNIVGEIRPEQLTLLGDAFDIDPLRSL